eukprot:7830289-Pyramimonas_sp.AAC.1
MRGAPRATGLSLRGPHPRSPLGGPSGSSSCTRARLLGGGDGEGVRPSPARVLSPIPDPTTFLSSLLSHIALSAHQPSSLLSSSFPCAY